VVGSVRRRRGSVRATAAMVGVALIGVIQAL